MARTPLALKQLSLVVFAALVAALVAIVPANASTTQTFTVKTTQADFSFTGAQQTTTVPANTVYAHVVATGGKGGNTTSSGGQAHTVTGDIAATPGATLYVEVGGIGQAANANTGVGNGGFNGGGNGGGGGGGASDVRTPPRSNGGNPRPRLVLGPGGGGGRGGPGPPRRA